MSAKMLKMPRGHPGLGPSKPASPAPRLNSCSTCQGTHHLVPHAQVGLNYRRPITSWRSDRARGLGEPG